MPYPSCLNNKDIKASYNQATGGGKPPQRLRVKAGNITTPTLTLNRNFAFGQNNNQRFRSLKNAFCLSTSPKAPCWRFPILAMTMYEQAQHCSFGLTKTFFSFLEKCVLPFHFAQSSVLAISNSRHDNVRASSTLFIWLNENVHLFNAPFLVSSVDGVENILQRANYSPLILAKNEA